MQRSEIMTRITTGASVSSPTIPATSAKPNASPNSQPSKNERPPESNELPHALLRPSPVPANDQITLEQLSRELHTDVRRLYSVIAAGYLRALRLTDDPDTTIVARPYPAALEWLTGMMAPLRLRPMLPLEGVALVIGMKVKDVRLMALHYGIPLSLDPLFGELISTTGYNRLLRAQYELRNPMRTDRQAMLETFVRMNRNVKDYSKAKRLPYSKRLEREIVNICKMPEPNRSLRATALWAAYKEASTVAECINAYQGKLREGKKSVESESLRKAMEFMNHAVTTTKNASKTRWNRRLGNLGNAVRVAQNKRWDKIRAEKANAAAAGDGPSSSG